MTAYYVGEGMSGFLPSIAALIQGIGGQSHNCKSQTSLKNFTLDSGITVLRNTTEIVPSYFYKEPRFSTRAFFLIHCSNDAGKLVIFRMASAHQKPNGREKKPKRFFFKEPTCNR